jgi:hypothetical protein
LKTFNLLFSLRLWAENIGITFSSVFKILTAVVLGLAETTFSMFSEVLIWYRFTNASSLDSSTLMPV